MMQNIMLRQIARNVVPTVARLTRPAVGGTLLARSGCRTLSTSGEDTIQIHWTLKDGTKLTTTDALGGNLMRAAHRHDIELEGACEGVCACSTCHVIFDEDVYDELPEASEDEEDMLDQAFGLTPTSRLGCQIILHKGLDGMHVELPPHTRNFAVDGHFNKPH